MSKRSRKLKGMRILALDLLIHRQELVDSYQDAMTWRDWTTCDILAPLIDQLDNKMTALASRHFAEFGNR